MKAWLDKAGAYTVKRIAGIPNPGQPVDLKVPPTGVLHTTEGTWDSALSVFRQHFAPHFMVGAGRIAQLIPLGMMAAALEHNGPPETNRWARAQIEVVGFSRERLYSFDAATEDALAALLAELHLEADIPLTRPFVDTMPDPPWATPKFIRRKAGKWGKEPGWYGHVEIPGNAHWDPGALEWVQLLARADSKLPVPTLHVGPAADPGVSADEWRWRQWAFGEGRFKAFGPFEGPRPKVPNPVPNDWHVRAIKFLLGREK